MKKLFVFILCACVMTALAVPAAAASLSDDEKYLIEQIKTVKLLDYAPTPAAINAITTYLMNNDADLTLEEVEQVLVMADDAVALAAATGTTSIKNLSTGVKDQILQKAQSAANVMGLKIAYDGSTNIVKVTTATGESIFTSDPIIKKTGVETTVLFAIPLALLLVCGLWALTRRQRRLAVN